MDFGLSGVFDLSCFLTKGYDFFLGVGKNWLAGRGAGRDGRGGGWDCRAVSAYRSASARLFFRMATHVGRLGFRAFGDPKQAEYFDCIYQAGPLPDVGVKNRIEHHRLWS